MGMVWACLRVAEVVWGCFGGGLGRFRGGWSGLEVLWGWHGEV